MFVFDNSAKFWFTFSFNHDVFLHLIFRIAEDGSIIFGGWARMAQPIVAFSVVEVSLSLFFFLPGV